MGMLYLTFKKQTMLSLVQVLVANDLILVT